MGLQKKGMLQDDVEVFKQLPSEESAGFIAMPQKEVEKEPFDVEETIEKINIPKNLVWISLWAAIGAIIGASVLTFKFSDAVVSILMLIVSIVIYGKVKKFEVNDENKHYIRNVSHALKAFFLRVTNFKMFYVNRKRNVIISAIVLFVEQPFLRAWLYYPISASIHYIALIVLILSLLFVLASKEIEMALKLTNIVGLTQSVSMFLIFVLFQYLAIETIIIAISLAIASSISRAFIIDINKERNEAIQENKVTPDN